MHSDPGNDKQPILPQGVLADRPLPDAGKSKKKKVIGGVVVGLAVLGLVLGLTLRSKDTDDNGGGGNPDVPINPYDLVGDLNDATQVYSGILKLSQEAMKKKSALNKILRQGLEDSGKVTLLDPAIIPTGENNKILDEISFEIGQSDFKTSYLWLSDSKNSRYSIPKSLSPKPQFAQIYRTDMCGLSIETNPFTFTFTDSANDNDVLVTSKNAHFLMTDKYLQLDLQLPSQKIFGLGERQREFAIKEGTWTMWARDGISGYDDGQGGNSGQGVHPFALVQSKQQGIYFGIYFRNSNAQSPIVQYNEDGTSVLSYVTTGGNIEMYFFWKGTAKQIISQYQSFVGKPKLPPFWSLGWYAGSAAYTKLDDVKGSVQGYKDAGIPLEGVWLDSNYAKSGANFQVDTTTFPDLAAYKTTLDTTNQKLILQMNTGLDATNIGEKYIIEGQSGGAFIKSAINPAGDYQGAIVNDANAKQTVFLDLFQSSAADLWYEGLNKLYTQTKFDGLSLVGNEPSAKCDGECLNGAPVPPEPSSKQPRQLSESFLQALKDESTTWYQSYSNQAVNSTYDLPFIPFKNANLDNKTLSLNATHSTGETEYDVHNLMGHMQSQATRKFFESSSSPIPGKRPFLVSSGSFSGSGVNAGHPISPLNRTFDDLKNSTAGVMNMNMFGVPFSGPDVCGTTGETDEELCARWIQASAFYPLSRQWSVEAGNEPFNMQDQANKDMVKASLQERLKYSRQLYSCLFEAQDHGETCFDPLLFHFPTDEKLNEYTELSYVFANALMITPVTEAGAESVSPYVPAGTWVNMKDYTYATSKGEVLSIPVQPDVPVTHLMPGKIVTKQEGDFMTTSDLKDNKFTLIANRDENGHAEGTLYVDDGETLEQSYDYVEFQLSANSFKKWVKGESANTKMMESLIITNAADLASVDFACARADAGYEMIELTATPSGDEGAEILTIAMKDGSAWDIGAIKDIHWGVSATDLNLCDISSQYYVVKGDAIDLTGPTATATLTSQTTKDILPDLTLTLTLLKTGVVNVHYTFADTTMGTPFEVPTSIVQPNKDDVSEDPLSGFVDVVNGDGSGPIGINIKNSAGTQVFRLNGMVLSKYLNFMDTTAVTKKGSKGVMGLFERVSSDLFLPDGVFSLWSLDTANPVETAKPPGNNLYGTHPIYMGMASDDTWFGVYTNLAAAQDWWLKTVEGTNREVGINTYAVGGAGDLYFMMGADANEVTKMYHTIVGTPVLIPQWALGWNQCKWGYNDTDALKAVVQGYEDAKIPLDTQWSDIDWMNNYQDFVYDPVNFKDLPDFVKDLHDKNMHYIPIIDAGLAKRSEGYQAYTDGVSKNVYIMVNGNSGTEEIFTGQVWPDDAAFPDFLAENTPTWWQDQMTNMHDQVAFDGLWLDMNEASNFCVGVCYQSQKAASPVKYQLPYIPTGRDLEEKSITLDAFHAGGITQLDAHSLFGTLEVKATHDWFTQNKKRTVIIERSSFAGMGKFGSRWLGDNFSTKEYMGYSVTGIMGHNIMGIPLAGSDICGFIGNTNPELCARWHMVGAFYPFSRNHNAWDTNAQEPYQKVFEETYSALTSYEAIMARAVFIKYSMIRYYYTELSMLSKEGGAFYKPMFFEFPSEAGAYEAQEWNIMLGSAAKLGILSTELNQNTTDFYFPEGLWCDVFNTAGADKNCITSPAGGQNVTLRSLAYDFYLHLRAGHMMPFQDAFAMGYDKIKTSQDLKEQPVELHVLPLCDTTSCTASGRYLNDDGVSVDTTANEYTLTYAQPVGGVITLTVAANDGAAVVDKNDVLGTLQIYNADAQGLDTDTYNVVATKLDGTTTIDLGKTVAYDATADRLVWTAAEGQDPVNLPEISTITLTAA